MRQSIHIGEQLVLGRAVAVKILPPDLTANGDRVRRFAVEARAASGLNHPNILTIYDVGTEETSSGVVHYIAMGLIEGETLRARIASGAKWKQTLDVMAQVSDGLAKAHAAGIVHRDLKPENVMVTRDDFAKILDFGLAKLLDRSDFDADAATAMLSPAERTAPGAIMGTAGYMSPEQAQAQPVDHRSDVFSFGAMLYEIASGAPPLRGKSRIDTLHKILYEEPRPLQELNASVPAELQRIVRKCLAKQPERRYQSMKEVAVDLRALSSETAQSGDAPLMTRETRVPRWTAPAAAVLCIAVLAAALVTHYSGRAAPRTRALAAVPNTQKPGATTTAAIAVLPFDNMGGRPEHEYLVDGMTESIITDLARVENFLIIARNTVFRYKGKAVDVRQVGRDLGVQYVLQGSAQRVGDVLRVNTQLIDVSSGFHVWAERYDRNATDVLALQDQISGRIVTTLRGRFSRATHAALPTSNTAAYDAYLRARYAQSKVLYDGARYADSHAKFDEVAALYERAIALDPAFALAHAHLAALYAHRFHAHEARTEWEERAYVLIGKALALDSSLAEAYAARGFLRWTHANGFPHEKAVSDFKRAVALSPNLPDGHHGLIRVYVHVGLFEEALREIDFVLRLEPDDTNALVRRMGIYLAQRRCDDAARATTMHPALFGGWGHHLHICNGRYDEALAQLTRSGDPTRDSTYPLLLARRGDRAGAEAALAKLLTQSTGLGHHHHREHLAAAVYAVLGEKDRSVDYLQRAAADGLPNYPEFHADTNLALLRGHPRFDAFMAELKSKWEHYTRTLGRPTPSRPLSL